MAIHALAVRAAKGRLEPFEYEPGPLGPDEVEVAVTHCGICHTDLAMIDNDWGFSQYPLVPGHEAVGTIAGVGERVSPDRIGQRVGVGACCGSCGGCEWCHRGLETLCAKNQATIFGHHGGWADRVRAQGGFAVPIPEGMASEHAGPMMCAGSTVFTPMLRSGVRATMRTAVVGIGGLGHLAVQFLRAFGCEVTAISTTRSKEDEARSLGAHHFLATRDTEELKQATRRFDFILSTVSADLPWGDYVNALRPQGRLVVVGLPETDIRIPAFPLLLERSVIGGAVGSPSDTTAMLEFATRHDIRPVIESFPLPQVNEAVDHLRAGKARYRVVLHA